MSILDISVSGLLTNKAAIATTAHNIANVSVEGYSRQRVSQSARTPQFIGGDFLGSGVEVGSITRIFLASEQLQVQSNTASFNSFDIFLEQANRIDGLLADSENGINNAIQSFFTALQGVANDPASIPARQVMLSETNTMVSRFNQVHNQLESQISEINSNIGAIAEEISAISTAIADLNNKISSSPGNPPPDLLDRRDAEITHLSELIAVQTLQQKDGTITVFIGTGQSLVVGAVSNALTAGVDPLDPKGVQLKIVAGGSSIDITSNVTGGKIGGLLDAVADVLKPAFNTIGRVALAISDALNSQHRLGLDLNNSLGGNFFTDINDPTVAASRVVAGFSNTGNAIISITIDNVSVLKDSDYQLYLNGGNYQLIDLTTNTIIDTFAPPVAPATRVNVAEGFTINFISGAPNAADSFKIQPTKNFSRDLTLLIDNSEQIAAASPIRGEQALSNIGSGSIKVLTVTDTTTVQFTASPNNLAPPIRIEFDPIAGEFSIIDITIPGAPVVLVAGVTGFVPNQDNNMLALAGAPYNAYGYEITMNGEPQPGDKFDINYNNNGFGNNANIIAMGDLQFASTLDNGNSSFQQGFGRIISSVGVRTLAAQIKRDAAESLLFQATSRKESTSGVNLDEEAANLIKFQQAYEASAQLIAVARTLFQTILDAVR